METQDSAEVHVCFAIALEPAEYRPSQNQELGLVWRPPKTIREELHRLDRFFQAVQQSGEMQATFDVSRLQLEQFAVGANGLPRHGARRQSVGMLEPLLGNAVVSRRCGLVDGSGWVHGDPLRTVDGAALG
jgi:hypothetical protein